MTPNSVFNRRDSVHFTTMEKIVLFLVFSCYYYEPLQSYTMAPRRSFVSPVSAPVATASSYRRQLAPPRHQEERTTHFYSTQAIDENYNTIAFRSSPQISQSRSVPARVVPSATLPQPARRHPITVRTPR